MDRLSMLLSMVTTKPNDPFPRYGLAMEFKKLGSMIVVSRSHAWPVMITPSPSCVRPGTR